MRYQETLVSTYAGCVCYDRLLKHGRVVELLKRNPYSKQKTTVIKVAMALYALIIPVDSFYGRSIKILIHAARGAMV